LERELRQAQSNTTILVHPGRYAPAERLRLGGPNGGRGLTHVALRGASGNRDDVVIEGEGLEIGNADGVEIANLTFRSTKGVTLDIRGELGAGRPHVYNIRFADAGGQMLRATAIKDLAGGGVHGGIVEYSVFEYTSVDPNRASAGGISVSAGRGWILRYNIFRNIRSGPNAPRRLRPAVVMRDGSDDTQTHNNLFIDCDRGVAYGMGAPDEAAGHVGGAIYNNVIYRRRGLPGDAGIMLWGAPRTKVYHNTVILNGTYKRPIEYRFPSTTDVDFRNNLTDGAIGARDGAHALMAGNYVKATPAMFRNPRSSDLRLTSLAGQAIDKGVQIAEWPFDWDGDARPIGARSDIGADEYQRQ